MKKRIYSIEIIKSFAFVGIFCAHTELNGFRGFGKWGVSIFFIVLGFGLVYGYYGSGRISNFSIRDNFVFMLNKIKKLYPVFIVTTLAMTALEFVGNQVDSMNIVLTKLALNCLLIQEWIPFKYRSLNGVSWFLCTCTLAYFIFPYILRYMEKSYTKKKANIAIILSFAVEILIVCLGNYLGIKEVHNSVLESNIQAWLIYYFPLSRIWDVFIGANIGYLFLQNSNDSISESSALEVIAILFNMLVLIINTMVTPKHSINGNSVVLYPNLRWLLSLLFTISSGILIYIFALERGKISKFLIGKTTLYLAKISSYGFLIHYVVLAYKSIIYRMLPKIFGGGYERFWWDYGRWLNLSIGFVDTLICIELYVRFENRIKRIKLNAK